MVSKTAFLSALLSIFSSSFHSDTKLDSIFKIIVSEKMMLSWLDPSIRDELKWSLQTALMSWQTVFAAALMLFSVIRVLLLELFVLPASSWMWAIKLRNTASVFGNLEWGRVLLGYLSRYFTFVLDPVPTPKLGSGFDFSLDLATTLELEELSC